MIRLSFVCVLAATTTLLLVSTVRAADPISFTKFDVPGATANDLEEAYFVPGINEDGVIVGTIGTAAGGAEGFIRTPGGATSTQIVDPNNPAHFTVLYRVNDEEVMVGWYTNDQVITHSFFLADGQFTAYDFPGAFSTYVRSLNNRGDITGNFQLSANDPGTGFITPRYGQPITFKAPDPTTNSLAPEAVNDLRAVVGWYTTPSFPFHGFLRTPSGKFIDIVFPGTNFTRAFGINDCGVIVGRYRSADGSRHGFYGRYGHLQSLDVPGSVDTTADGINNEGRIVGQFIDSGGMPHGYVTSKVLGAGCDE
jgi:hypothetical protein